MAGNVLVELQLGSLVIHGDDQSNGVSIAPVVAAGRVQPDTFRVAGISRNGTTTINGSTTPLIMRFVSDDVRIELGGGEDLLNFNRDIGAVDENGLPTNPPLTIDDDLILDLGDGDDLAFLTRLNVLGRFQGDLGAGRDQLQVSDLALHEINGFALFGGAGRDRLVLDLFSMSGEAVIDMGRGDEQDYVAIQRSGISGELLLLTHEGRDIVEFDEFSCDDLTVDTGDGQDFVTMRYVTVDQLFARLGEGDNDYLSLELCGGRRAILNGGGGRSDRLDLLNVDFDVLTDDGFEVIVR